jgi:hypothetical protein
MQSRSIIVNGAQDACEHVAFLSDRYAVFHTGPSATGDIEGVLIRGPAVRDSWGGTGLPAGKGRSSQACI